MIFFSFFIFFQIKKKIFCQVQYCLNFMTYHYKTMLHAVVLSNCLCYNWRQYFFKINTRILLFTETLTFTLWSALNMNLKNRISSHEFLFSAFYILIILKETKFNQKWTEFILYFVKNIIIFLEIDIFIHNKIISKFF